MCSSDRTWGGVGGSGVWRGFGCEAEGAEWVCIIETVEIHSQRQPRRKEGGELKAERKAGRWREVRAG